MPTNPSAQSQVNCGRSNSQRPVMSRPTQHTYNIHEAKTQLSKLLEQVARGDEVVIARAGVPWRGSSRLSRLPRRAFSARKRDA